MVLVENNTQYANARDGVVQEIMNSPHRKKLVVGGPGTGKTHLFATIVDGKQKCLTLTFINKLVQDLCLELYGLSEVRTLHSFALGQIPRKKGKKDLIKVFPKLSALIRQDTKTLLNEDIDFDKIFNEREDDNAYLPFYKNRKDYYKSFGFTDIIFSAVKYFEAHEDKIPSFDLILIDEFQDFSKLEVSLIDLLSKKSPILIVGDDDQALYDFKIAKPDLIRERHKRSGQEFAAFCLPYCSRSTRVIVEATNNVINTALSKNLLSERIDKDFVYYECEEKNKESDENPYIVYTHCFEDMMPYYITKQIEQIAAKLRREFSVLVISPTGDQSSRIGRALEKYGFSKIKIHRKSDLEDVKLIDGIKFLLNDKESNLGWRIAAGALAEPDELKTLLEMSTKEHPAPFADLISQEIKQETKSMLTTVRKISRKGTPDPEKLSTCLKYLGESPYNLQKQYIVNTVLADSPRFTNEWYYKIPVTTATIEGSKGLSGDYVFITHFDDQFFIKNVDKSKISDRDVCKLIVALTRAKVKVFLISSKEKVTPTFLNWIDRRNIRLEKR